jgi:hypothetical protein
MKPTFSLLFSIMAIATSFAQQMAFSLAPQTPASNDDLRLTISQEFESTCYTSSASFERVENTINVEIESRASGEICLPAFFPQSATVNLGKLKTGTYQVNVTWIGAPSWGSKAGVYSFDVTASAPTLELFMFEPIGLRFESAVDVTYQLQWSTDLESWFDLGGVIAGTGGEIIANDIMEPGPTRFYQVKLVTQDDPVLRDFLSARNTWRSAGIDDYTIEVRWGSSWFFWRGIVTVRDNEIISAVPIETNYLEPPAQRTIDDWFGHFESFLDPRADRIDVTYDRDFGFIMSAFIDIDLRIADEEQSWTILDFQPLR